MAASYSLTMKCNECSRTVTLTNVTDAAQVWFKHYKCPECGNPLGFRPSSIALTHSGNVGSNATITHTITKGSIVSAAS